MLLRILIADDHTVLRTTLKTVLETHADWQVCGEAANGLEAVQKAADLKPDVIILDLAMPKMDGLQAASQISTAFPHLPILIYTNYDLSREAKLGARKHGVRQVINKGASPGLLVKAIAALQNDKLRDSSWGTPLRPCRNDSVRLTDRAPSTAPEGRPTEDQP